MEEEELLVAHRVDLPAMTRAPLRAALAAYLIVGTVQPAEEPVPAGCRSESLTVPTYRARRATGEAYEASRNRLALPDDLVSPTIYSPFVSRPQRAPRRSAAAAYETPPRAIYLEDEPHTQAVLYPTVARPARRASAAAYECRSTFQIGDAMPPLRELLPTVAWARPRSSPTAYWRDQAAPPTSEPAMQTTFYPDVVRGPCRTISTAYDVAATFPPVPEPPATIGVAIPSRAPAARRPAGGAFVITTTFAPQSEPTLFRELLPDVAPRRIPRAAGGAYAIATRELEEFLPAERPRGFLDTMPRMPRRPAAAAYVITQDAALYVAVSGAFTGPWYPEQAEVFPPGGELAETFVPGNETAQELL